MSLGRYVKLHRKYIGGDHRKFTSYPRKNAGEMKKPEWIT